MRALVTGASGFIGSRLMTRLSRMGIGITALVRHGVIGPWGDAAHCNRVRGDVTDPGSVRRAATGCELVFHCAWGGRALEEARRINVRGVRHVVEAAAAAGVRRVVHLSSMAVHGRPLPPVLTEDHPLRFDGNPYAVSKAEGERAAFEGAATHGVELVALRPTLVYGPRSPVWLLGYFDRLKHERLALIDGGAGLANLLYVDDLVDAMWAAAQRPGVSGETFLISAARPVTWYDYLGHLARMCGKPMPPSVPLWRARLEVQWFRMYTKLAPHPARLLEMDLAEMPRRTTVDISKARRLLGYAPRFSLDDGMKRSEEWLRKEGHLPPIQETHLSPVEASESTTGRLESVEQLPRLSATR